MADKTRGFVDFLKTGNGHTTYTGQHTPDTQE
jgi:hypothetical protein